jgi:putative endonuclease
MTKPFFVYMLICADGAYYVGHTDDLDRRVAEHDEGGRCLFTTPRRPVQLVWFTETMTREDAKEIEYQLKSWSRAKKSALIREDIPALRAAARKRFPPRQR